MQSHDPARNHPGILLVDIQDGEELIRLSGHRAGRYIPAERRPQWTQNILPSSASIALQGKNLAATIQTA